MVAGHGIDIVEVERIRRAIARFGFRFIARIFDALEIDEASKFKDPSQYYASRFAAKEAFSKAVGTGFRGFGPRDVIIVRDADKPPRIEFSQKLREVFPAIRQDDFILSISHEKKMAAASVIMHQNLK